MATSAKGATSIAGTSAGKALASALSTYGTTNIGGQVAGTGTTTAKTSSAPSTASTTSNLKAGFYKDTAGNVREYSPGFTNPSYFQGATYLGTSEANAPAPKSVVALNADKAIKDYSQKVADVNALSDQIAQNKAAATKTPTATTTPKLTSVVDYLASQGQPSDFASRAGLAKQYGIQGYAGTAQQNMQLLNILQNQPKKDNTADLLKAATNAKYQATTPIQTPTPATTPTTPATPEPTQPVQESDAMKRYKATGEEYLTQLDNTYTNMQADLDKIRNGTFPLSVSDQTILDQTQKAIERQKQMQIDANDTYQKAIEVAGVSSGRARYAPELQAGNLANAVNVGIQKIADIESEGALTLAKLQQSIDDKNYARVKDYYNSLTTILKEKTNTLMAMQQATMQNEKDLRDYNYKVAQDAIQNIYQNKQLDWQMKNAEANRILEQSKFDWQKTMDLKNYNLKAQQENLPSILASLPAVSSTNGTANSADQEKFLSSLDPDTAALVKAVSNYDEEPEIAGKRSTKGLNAATLTALALRYNPNYSPLKYDSIKKYKMDLSDGTRANKIISLNTAINHLSDFQPKAKELAELNANKAGWFGKGYSTVSQLVAQNSQDPRVVSYNQWKDTIAAEVAGLLKGTAAAASQEEIKAQLASLENTISPSQADTIVQNYGEILAGRLLPLYDEYKQQTGQAPDVNRFVFPRSQETLKVINESLPPDKKLNLDRLIPNEFDNYDYSKEGMNTNSLPNSSFF